MTTATGCRISLPGSSAARTSGIKRDAGAERGHEHGHEPLERAAHDHLAREAFALVLHEVQVVARAS